MRSLFLPALSLFLAAHAYGATPSGQTPIRPNVVYIVLDDWGYYEWSGAGHKVMKTPNIDALAKESMRFSQCLAGGPVCAPTRCALLTGKDPGHMTVRDNGVESDSGIRLEEATLGTMFHDAGYVTGGFGKWGIGNRGSQGTPELHGFDTFFGYYDQIHAHTYYPAYLIRNSAEVPLAGNFGNPLGGMTFSQYEIENATLDFVRQNAHRPFFLYCPWTPPHGYWHIPSADPAWKLFRDEPWKQGQISDDDAKTYAAYMSLADREIGELIALLQQQGIYDNTILFLSGDNGGQPYFDDAEHPHGIFSPNTNPVTGVAFRGGKDELYEGGLRVAYFAHWKDHIAAGAVNNHLCAYWDVMPTLAELTGVRCPVGTDGISFAPTLLGNAGQREHESLYWEFQKQTAVRLGNWKAVRPAPDAAWELYDLSTDVSEAHDVARQHPEIVAHAGEVAAKEHQAIVPGKVIDPVLVNKDQQFLGHY